MGLRENILEIKGLRTELGGVEVHKGVNLEVKEGEVLVIMGGSGCGKSVLCKSIIGLVKPKSGEILIKGKNITKLRRGNLDRVRSEIGFVFQEGALFDSLSIWENIGFRLIREKRFNINEIKKIVKEKLRQVGLNEEIMDCMTGDLSRGMRKRVGLARAITTKVKIILYDEPTTGLDPIMTDIINELITNLRSELNITSIVVTHDMKSAFKIGDRIAFLKEGKINWIGLPDKIKGLEGGVYSKIYSRIMRSSYKNF